jgi:hypothetical protein
MLGYSRDRAFQEKKKKKPSISLSGGRGLYYKVQLKIISL